MTSKNEPKSGRVCLSMVNEEATKKPPPPPRFIVARCWVFIKGQPLIAAEEEGRGEREMDRLAAHGLQIRGCPRTGFQYNFMAGKSKVKIAWKTNWRRVMMIMIQYSVEVYVNMDVQRHPYPLITFHSRRRKGVRTWASTPFALPFSDVTVEPRHIWAAISPT